MIGRVPTLPGALRALTDDELTGLARSAAVANCREEHEHSASCRRWDQVWLAFAAEIVRERRRRRPRRP
jgi:hypothetical protein